MQQLDVYYQHFLNMFRASLSPSSGEQDVCYCTLCAALVLLDVVDSGCGALSCMVRALCANLKHNLKLWVKLLILKGAPSVKSSQMEYR